SFDGVTTLALDLKDRLEKIARVRGVNINAASFFGSDRAFSVTLQPDRSSLARFRLTSQDLASAVGREVRGSVGGTRLEIGGEEITVSVKAKGSRERSMEELSAAIIPTAEGSPVKISDVAG